MGPWAATLMVAGNLVGSGIYLLPASLAAIGTVSILAWALAAAGCLVVALLFAKVAVRAGDGGIVGFVEHVFGTRVAAITGALYWLMALVGNVAIALAVTGYLSFFFPAAARQPWTSMVSAGVIWLFVLLNLAGARRVAGFAASMMVVGLLPVLLVATLGWRDFDMALFRADWNRTGGTDLSAVLGALGLVLWAFLGFETALAVARQVERPHRNVPIAILGGLGIATVIYMAASAAIGGLVPAGRLETSAAPFADATVVILGAAAGAVAAVSAALKASGTLGSWILVTAETGEAMAPGSRAQTAARPATATLLLTGTLMSLLLLATANPTVAGQFGVLANATVVLMLLVYAIVGAALLRAGPAAPAGWFLGGGTILLSLGVIAIQPPLMLGVAGGGILLSLLVAQWAQTRR